MPLRVCQFLVFIAVLGCLRDQINSEPLQFEIQGESGLLINPDNGAILFEKEAYTPRYPASTTKIAVALYALHLVGDRLQDKVEADGESLKIASQEAKRKSGYKIPSWYLEPDGVRIGIKQGELFTWRALLEGMLIPSGNDAATVIAHELGPTVPVFMDRLNAYLTSLGCQQTKYYSPNGFHHPEHVSTAFDLALMTKEALKHPIFCEIVSQPRFIRPKSNKQPAATFLQTNRLLRPGNLYYPKAIGVKTGYHLKAKKTFIGAARSKDRTLIVVLLGYSDHNQIFRDAAKLFDAAFNQPMVEKIYLQSGEQPFQQVLAHADRPLKTFLKEPLSWSSYPAEEPKAKCLLYWYPVHLPVSAQQVVGEVQIVAEGGQVLRQVPLLAANQVGEVWPYRWFSNLRAFYRDHSIISIVYLLILFCSLAFTIRIFRSTF